MLESCNNFVCRISFKRGQVGGRLPANRRLDCITPVTYALFSRLLRGATKDIPMREQPRGQTAFRLGFGCDDHLS
eukprot:4915142-Pyramimonas_sp.AAC.1